MKLHTKECSSLHQLKRIGHCLTDMVD
jgi:hypothetical protein